MLVPPLLESSYYKGLLLVVEFSGLKVKILTELDFLLFSTFNIFPPLHSPLLHTPHTFLPNMNAEEAHYLKRLKILQKCVQDRIEVGKLKQRNYLCCASWERKSKTFKLHHILQSSKYHVNHIEVDSLDKLEDLKKEVDILYIFTRFSPCLDCTEMLVRWTEHNRMNMIILGFDISNSDFDIKQIKSQIPNNLLLFNVSKRQMLKKEERENKLNETFTKETFEELLQRMEGRFQRSDEKQKALKPLIKTHKLFGVKVNNFVKERKLCEHQHIEKEKIIIGKLLRMRKSRDDILSTESSKLSTPVSSGHKRHKQLQPMSDI